MTEQRRKALVVDDEILVGMATADMLTEAGYEVTEASGAPEALKLVAAGLAPDILITDHAMPDMSGLDLAKKLLVQFPAMQVLIMTGYSAGFDTPYPYISKPFLAHELLDKITN